MKFLYVFLGAGLGGILRYAIALPFNKVHVAFPLGTILVNLIGCFFAGIILSIIVAKSPQESIIVFLLPGFLGGFTTFSAFSMETITLFLNGNLGWALWNVLASLGGLIMTFVGFIVANWLQ